MTTSTLTPRQRSRAITTNRWAYRLSRNWLGLFSLGFGLYVGLPFLAPVFMKIGWEPLGKVIYAIYSLLCHQLPQRSFFLFGQNAMYSLSDIQTGWDANINPFVLRKFVGNPALGWKVAWSDRMVSMYTSILIFAWIWYPLRKRIKKLPWWVFFLFLVPMGIDRITHFISDFAGIGQGFRDTNLWLATLTNNIFSNNFYAGDALGSFNSWMRFITGILFGLGIVWFGFPFLNEAFDDMTISIRIKFLKAELDL